MLNKRLTELRLSPRMARGGPSETSEQIQVVRRLRAAGLDAFAVPNGGSRRAGEGARLAMSGVESGVSDLLIVTPPPGGTHGTALEMKRADGAVGDVTDDQWAWLRVFDRLGWQCAVGYGWKDALAKLRLLGYELALCAVLCAALGASGDARASDVPRYVERDLSYVPGPVRGELELAGRMADVDPAFFAAVTWVESRWLGRRDGDGGASIGLWQMTASAARSVLPHLTREEARGCLRIPWLRSWIAGLFWARLIRRYGRAHAAPVYSCGPRCRRVRSTRTARKYWRYYREIIDG